MRNFLIILACLFLLCSCKTTQIVEVPKVHTEYIHQTDSVYVLDSMVTIIEKKADTVFVDRLKYKYIYKIQADTVIVNDTTTVVKTVEIEKTKTKHPWYEKYLWIISCGTILSLIYLVWRWFKSFPCI